MAKLLAEFIATLKQHDNKKLSDFYFNLSENDKSQVQLFLKLQGQRDKHGYDYFQQLSYQLNDNSPIPKLLISQIKNLQCLMFFTPLLKSMANFAEQDDKARNCLHYLFVGRGERTPVPFNYIKSLLLFESNLFLPKALTQTESNGLTPLAAFLHLNTQGRVLPQHEITAFLGLLEVEHSTQTINQNQLSDAVTRFNKQKRTFSLSDDYIEQKRFLLASYYGVNSHKI